MPQSVPRPSGHYCPPVPDTQRGHLAHRPQGNDFATCMPHARSADHFVLRISSEWAAS
jgi:hypothetical protein